MGFDSIRKALESYRDFFTIDEKDCQCDTEVDFTCEACARRMEAKVALFELNETLDIIKKKIQVLSNALFDSLECNPGNKDATKEAWKAFDELSAVMKGEKK